MAIVTVKNKFQVVIPLQVREQLGINQGDVLEAKVERGKLTYTPKTVVIMDRAKFPSADGEYTPEQRRAIDVRLKEARKGPIHGPFANGDEIAAYLKSLKLARPRAKKSKTKPA